ncbi:L-threonylcarbamoyladenylate synthase [Desulfovibrio inopinatus]|uniref:L-threonylcarbamoyladenylate synthase n=1 Tax=Desulfovibrio inopinatus TaxID=102109 RepID=UPI000401916E|nr:L-threonylcarbamoyladenylate synthase [Desulfovibrio inopinatus]
MTLYDTQVDVDRAVQILQQGRPLIYPTETFFALGAGAFFEHGQQAVVNIKNRPEGKAFPLLCANMAQVESILAPSFFNSQYMPIIYNLADCFWPGPLSIVVPARTGLPPHILGPNHTVSIRITSHPTAAALALKIGMPISASSANVSGQPPVHDALLLDPTLLATTGACCVEGPSPAGGLPSTVITLSGGRTLHLLREGATSRQALCDAGFQIYEKAVPR